jgi:hypothetical protein
VRRIREYDATQSSHRSDWCFVTLKISAAKTGSGTENRNGPKGALHFRYLTPFSRELAVPSPDNFTSVIDIVPDDIAIQIISRRKEDTAASAFGEAVGKLHILA